MLQSESSPPPKTTAPSDELTVAKAQGTAVTRDNQPPTLSSQKEIADLLAQVEEMIVAKDLPGLERISSMTPSRRRMLEALFEKYATLEVSLAQTNESPGEIIATLEISKLVLPGGEVAPVLPLVRHTRITIPRDGDKLGLLVW